MNSIIISVLLGVVVLQLFVVIVCLWAIGTRQYEMQKMYKDKNK